MATRSTATRSGGNEEEAIAIERLIPVGAPNGMNPMNYACIAKRLPGVK